MHCIIRCSLFLTTIVSPSNHLAVDMVNLIIFFSFLKVWLNLRIQNTLFLFEESKYSIQSVPSQSNHHIFFLSFCKQNGCWSSKFSLLDLNTIHGWSSSSYQNCRGFKRKFVIRIITLSKPKKASFNHHSFLNFCAFLLRVVFYLDIWMQEELGLLIKKFTKLVWIYYLQEFLKRKEKKSEECFFTQFFIFQFEKKVMIVALQHCDRN